MKTFVLILLTLTFAITAFAGLDNAGRFDDVVAVYRFENVQDSGPRGFDGILLENATIVNNGKIGKCLRLKGRDAFGHLNDLHLGVTGEFSIVAWIKMPSQPIRFILSMNANDDDETLIGSVALSIEPSGALTGADIDAEDNNGKIIESENTNASDNKWHHIAFTKYNNTHFLFFDGNIVAKERSARYIGFVGDQTVVLISGPAQRNLTGSVFVDEVGFFETGFSIYEIRGLYNGNLINFLEAMPVNPQEKVATTWGMLKQSR